MRRRIERSLPALRVLALLIASLGLTACTKTGLNAGKQGGLAWIGMSVMLIAIAAILWFFIGRED